MDGWTDGVISLHFTTTLYQIQISWHVLIWFWVLTPQTTPSFQSGHLLKAWSRQSQAMSVIHLVESVGCKPPVSFLSRTWHVLNGVDAKMLALPTVAGEGLIHLINGIIPGLDPLGDPKECESSTDWHSQYVPLKNGDHHRMIQKEIIVCQTCFRDAAFSLGCFCDLSSFNRILNCNYATNAGLFWSEIAIDSYSVTHHFNSYITEAHGSSTWGALPSSATFSSIFAQDANSMHWLNLQQEKCILPGVSPLPASMGWGTAWMKHDGQSSSSLCSSSEDLIPHPSSQEINGFQAA